MRDENMSEQFSRTELLLGSEALDKLAGKRVAIFGVGGVGGYVCEALVRSGIGEFDICDDDKVAFGKTNLLGRTHREQRSRLSVGIKRSDCQVKRVNAFAAVTVSVCVCMASRIVIGGTMPVICNLGC